MKLPKELYNGCIIFIGIVLYFLLMEFLGLAHLFYLRLLNALFILYGVNRMIRINLAEGKNIFVSNIISAMTTSFIGVILSVTGLLIYSYIQGGDIYIQKLPESFLFGGHPSINIYCFSLFFEGIASSVLVTLLLMLYYNNQFITD